MITFNKIKHWLMWLLPVTFCAFQFVLRLFPSHVQNELMDHFRVNATAFGFFSAAYYLGYAGFQIPIALLLEKFKPRAVIALSAITCAMGSVIMATSTHWWLAVLSRFLIGAGSVTGLLGTTKIIIQWFPVKHHAKMIGLSVSVALIGAIYGGEPINIFVEKFPWESVLLMVGACSALIGIAAYLVIQEPPKNANTENTTQNVNWHKEILSLFKNKMFLTLAIANFLMVGCLEGFADIWGVNYLALARGISKDQASLLTSLIFFGMLIGAPILSFIADATKLHIELTAYCGILIAFLLGLLLIDHELFTFFHLKILMIVVGMLSGYQALVFVIGERFVSKNMANTAIAGLNCINMLGGAFFHESIGIFVDLAARQHSKTTFSAYTLHDYSWGLAVIPTMSLLGGLLLFITKAHKKIRI